MMDDIRSSGRLFWPVGYTVMAAAIAVVALRARRYIGVGLLLGAVVMRSQSRVAAVWVRNRVTQVTPALVIQRRRGRPHSSHDELKIFPTYVFAPGSKAGTPIADLVFYCVGVLRR